MIILLAPLAGRLAVTIGTGRLVAGGLVIMGAGLLLLSSVDGHTGYADLLRGLLVGGFGAALTIPLAGAAIDSVAVEQSGIA